jgi:hypothetical protein
MMTRSPFAARHDCGPAIVGIGEARPTPARSTKVELADRIGNTLNFTWADNNRQ